MRLKADWIGYYTIARREVVRIIRIWQQTLLPPVITMALYFVIFGSLMGDRIGPVGGLPYILYIMPGLVMMAVINNSYLNVTSSFFSNKFQRNVEEMLVAPLRNSVILWGYITGGIVRGIIIGIFVILTALFFTKVPVYNWIATVFVAIFTAILFSIAGLINGIFAKKFDDISIVPVFILTPLTYFGGVFYSIDMLSPFWQAASYANPIFYMVNAFRYAMLGQADVELHFALGMIVGATVLSYMFCLWILNKGIGVKS